MYKEVHDRCMMRVKCEMRVISAMITIVHKRFGCFTQNLCMDHVFYVFAEIMYNFVFFHKCMLLIYAKMQNA